MSGSKTWRCSTLSFLNPSIIGKGLSTTVSYVPLAPSANMFWSTYLVILAIAFTFPLAAIVTVCFFILYSAIFIYIWLRSISK